MKIFLKYVFWLLSFGTLVIFYFLNTHLGHQNLGFFLGNYLSKTTKNKIEVVHLDIKRYPELKMLLKVNSEAHVLLEGEVDKHKVNMDYHLVGDSFRLNTFYLQDKVNVKGHLSGPFSHLRINGEGDFFGGEGRYSFIKVPHYYKDMNLSLHQADGQKVLKFLKQPLLLEGKINLDAQFTRYSKLEKQGHANIHMSKAFMPDVAPNIPFSLNTNMTFDEISYRYTGKIDSNIGNLSITNGKYDPSKQNAQADYDLQLKDLRHFEKFLKYKYKGALESKGKIIYNNGLLIKGDTNKLGGNLHYVYRKNNLDLELTALSLEAILYQFSSPALLTSDVYGTINCDLQNQIVVINTELKKTRVKKTNITTMLYETGGIDVISGVYDNSTFIGGFQNNILYSELKIDDGISHLYLSDMQLNAQNNQVHANFTIKLQGQEVFGEIYGTVEDPQLSVDMSRLLKYQMSKQLNGWLGTENKAVIKSIEKDLRENLNKIDVEDVKEKAKLLINDFF